MLLSFFCLAIFLDFAKLAAAEDTNDPDAPGMVLRYYAVSFLIYIKIQIKDTQIAKTDYT